MDRQAIIARVEKLFKTDVRYVGKNGFWVLLGQIIATISGLCLSIAFANWLPQHDYGIYRFILATAGIIGIFRLSGLQQSVVQAVARGYDSTTIAAIKISLRWSGLMFGLALAVALYYLWNDNHVIGLGILFATLSNVTIGTIGLYSVYLTGKQNFKISNIHYIIFNLGTAAVLIGSLYVTDNVMTLIILNFVATLFILAGLAYSTIRKIDTSTPTSSENIRFGKHLSLQNVFIITSNHIDKIIIFQFVGSIQLAIYAFALMLPDQIRSILKSILSIIIPKYSIKNTSDLRKSIRQKVWLSSVLMVLPVGLFILIAPLLYSWLFPLYGESIIYSQIFAVGLLFMPANHFLHIYFLVQEQTRVLYYCKIIPSILNIFLVIIGIYLFGVIGAIFAQILSRLAQVGLFTFYYFHHKPN